MRKRQGAEQGIVDKPAIEITGARQNNLKGFDLRINLNTLTVVTGVSGSGKSSLAFDTVYAEGQRRYVETFSPYARQFLDRMDKPRVEKIEGIPPAIAIDQTHSVRTSRSTVGTMTELNDHLKLLYARAARLICRGCDREVRRDTPDSIADMLFELLPSGSRMLITFRVPVLQPQDLPALKDALQRQGYGRFHREAPEALDVIQDRLSVSARSRGRLVDSLEAALRQGRGKVSVVPVDADGIEQPSIRFSADLHCAGCDLHYRDPVPNLFSFNSAVGACETCRGFGRTIGVDYGMVVPDETLSLAAGAVRPFQTAAYRECQDDLLRFARRLGVELDHPWRDLSDSDRRWILEGDGSWENGRWYGVEGFFKWLESKSYKMHIRVLLSKYRAYSVCEACHGGRLKPEALCWRLGPQAGLNIHDLMCLPIENAAAFASQVRASMAPDRGLKPLLGEICSRFGYLNEVGLGYLTLDRQSRTLSGGEVQRIHLTTALGTTLVNTLFVLDEPSTGLHPRDTTRLISVLKKLRAAGNTLLVVEHDADIIRAADAVIDMGPGAGEQGGEIVFHGAPSDLITSANSLTGVYLRGERSPTDGLSRFPHPSPDDPHLEIIDASANNLKNIDVRIPLGRMVCITGVSGSGKSTLIEDVLYRALLKRRGVAVEEPGAHREIRGMEHVGDVLLVDQQPIGRTTRSNPATYVGAWNVIRDCFAAQPLARERGYKAGTFSFNSGKRCPACGGNGFQHIEMQFLSDVYLRCPECDGTRFQAEVLDVRLCLDDGASQSVANVLEMTVTEAFQYFADVPAVCRALEPLQAAGLGYLRLGQSVPTLSGGEAQRLKLAARLGEKDSKSSKPSLFLLDEPTTELHFDDVAVLLKTLRELVLRGNTVVVIEHHTDVMRSADWIVDLGPEGGAGGGQVVCCGPPEAVVSCPQSHTGAALKQGSGRVSAAVRETRPALRPRIPAEDGMIRILNAREHNLKNADVSIPRGVFAVISGLSGSGKSTVAFDILYSEGQRRYLESLNAYARQFVQPASRPEVDAVLGVPPTVAIEQRISRGGVKSTVATITEVYHYLRLLFVKLGIQHCPECGGAIQTQSQARIVKDVLRRFAGQKVLLLAPLVSGRKGIYKELAKWASEKGFERLRVDGDDLKTSAWPVLDRYREHDIELPLGPVECKPAGASMLSRLVAQALDHGSGLLSVERLTDSGDRSTRSSRKLYSSVRACPDCGRSFPELDPRLFSFNSKQGWCGTCFGTGVRLRGFDEEQTGEEAAWDLSDGGRDLTDCPDCQGKRLRPEALFVRFKDRRIDEYTAFTVAGARKLFAGMKWTASETTIARDLQSELCSRLRFMEEVGLGYLTLDRAAPTLSGGEAQRIRLAAQLGSNLRGVCYVLDEPTIGLHPHDNKALLATLRRLQAKGNSIVVVEHDEDTIRQADYIIDLGPGAGIEGGRVVACGSPAEVMKNPDSVTGRWLKDPLQHPLRGVRRPCQGSEVNHLSVCKATLHNLKGMTVDIPLNRLVCVTGVSGSGKSTLVRDVLLRSLSVGFSGTGRGRTIATGCESLTGTNVLRRVLEVDQTPIGRTPRSCPATYVGFWDRIRAMFAATPEARMRGYDASRFSFNTGEGRCSGCGGNGYQKIEMSFLPNVTVICELCGGRRFSEETCEVRWGGVSIAEVLALSVDQAADLFSAQPEVARALKLLQDVGLGYLTLGQQSPTLSGGEAQRIKLVSELSRSGRLDQTLYILDEPTVGLHIGDVKNLIDVLHRLVDSGGSVVIIEHNLDLIAEADWVIDLGPGGGDKGGRVIGAGTPERISQLKRSLTGYYLNLSASRPPGDPGENERVTFLEEATM